MSSDDEHISGEGRPVRIGILTPSSNTVLEPYTARLLEPLFPNVSAHYARFRVTKIALDEAANQQFGLAPILAAADLLADAHCDVIAWNGTSASWLGFDTDRTLCAEITARTGIKATSAILGFNSILEKLSVRKLGLVTPYTADVQERIIGNYEAQGIEIIGEQHSGLTDNFSFATVSEEAIKDMCLRTAAAKPDAIAIVCTNARGAFTAQALEDRLGIPVLDSVSFTLWACLDALNVPMARLSKFGSMFSL